MVNLGLGPRVDSILYNPGLWIWCTEHDVVRLGSVPTSTHTLIHTYQNEGGRRASGSLLEACSSVSQVLTRCCERPRRVIAWGGGALDGEVNPSEKLSKPTGDESTILGQQFAQPFCLSSQSLTLGDRCCGPFPSRRILRSSGALRSFLLRLAAHGIILQVVDLFA